MRSSSVEIVDVCFEQRHLIIVLLLFLFLVSTTDSQDPTTEAGGAPGGAAGNESAVAGAAGGTSTTEDPLLAKFDLECYQCIADGTELVPPCDSVFFTSLNSLELKELEFQCPKELPDFCVKKEIEFFKTGIKMTFRGCTGKVDEMDNELRVGCIRIYDNLSVTEMCFCSKKNCNLSYRFQSEPVTTVLCFIAGVLILMKVRNDVVIST